MSTSAFIQRLPLRAWRYLPGPVPPGNLKSKLDLRPARFVVGWGEPVRWRKLAEREGLRQAPVNVAFYLGRVEEVLGDEVLATAWERPSGRESTVTLSVAEHFHGTPPPPGSLLRIWTWVELPRGGQPEHKARIEVERRRLSEAERLKLRALLASIEQEGPGNGTPEH